MSLHLSRILRRAMYGISFDRHGSQLEEIRRAEEKNMFNKSARNLELVLDARRGWRGGDHSSVLSIGRMSMGIAAPFFRNQLRRFAASRLADSFPCANIGAR